jgi:hypothetical protein
MTAGLCAASPSVGTIGPLPAPTAAASAPPPSTRLSRPACVDGLRGARCFLGRSAKSRRLACVRPTRGDTLVAGPDEIRGSGPYQTVALKAPTGLLGVPISSFNFRSIFPISAYTPRSTDPVCSDDRSLCCPEGLLPRHYGPDYSRRFVRESNGREFNRLLGNEPPQPTFFKAFLASRPANSRHSSNHQKTTNCSISHLGNSAHRRRGRIAPAETM